MPRRSSDRENNNTEQHLNWETGEISQADELNAPYEHLGGAPVPSYEESHTHETTERSNQTQQYNQAVRASQEAPPGYEQATSEKIAQREQIAARHPDSEESKKRTPLMNAAYNGDIKEVRQLLAQGTNPNETKGWFGDKTALHYACYPDIALELINAGANIPKDLKEVKCVMNSREGAAQEAPYNDRMQVCEILLSKGCKAIDAKPEKYDSELILRAIENKEINGYISGQNQRSNSTSMENEQQYQRSNAVTAASEYSPASTPRDLISEQTAGNPTPPIRDEGITR